MGTFIISGTKSITHLIFTDDLLVFTKASRKSLLTVKKILEKFEAFSGLSTNPNISAIYYSKSVLNRAELNNILKFELPKQGTPHQTSWGSPSV